MNRQHLCIPWSNRPSLHSLSSSRPLTSDVTMKVRRHRTRTTGKSPLVGHGPATTQASRRRPQLPPHSEPGCDAATGAIPALVVVVVGKKNEGVVGAVDDVVVGGADRASLNGVTVTS